MELIAEIGQNHNGDMGLAAELIHAARENGADVAKFQIFDARALFPPREANRWFEYNCTTELSREQVAQLAAECDRAGIEFMASVFDASRVEWLEQVGVRRYKLASRSIRDRELIDAVVATGKTILVSLGHWHEEQFPAIAPRQQVRFLYCISRYPTDLQDVHLGSVDFARYDGFSDHTVGLTAAMAAFARGATIVEKHFTLDRNMYGPDHIGSMDPPQLAALHRFRTELRACL